MAFRKHCIIGSCPTVDRGGSCLKNSCIQWAEYEPPEEPETEPSIWDLLQKKLPTEELYNEVQQSLSQVMDMVEQAISEIGDGKYGKAKDTLYKVITELEG